MSTKANGLIVSVLAVMGLALSACSAPPTPTLTVFAAASMKSTFTTLGQKFEAAHPGVKVSFNFANGDTLATQIVEGAGADVFATASEAHLKPVVEAGLGSGEVRFYATNHLEIVVPPTNPARIAGWADLASPGVQFVGCSDATACGAATARIEAGTGIVLSPVTEEDTVTDVLAKVVAGEGDAGLVFCTDVITAGGKVRGVPFPEADQAITRNGIVALKTAPQPALAQQFVELVLSAEGQSVLAAAGFGAGG